MSLPDPVASTVRHLRLAIVEDHELLAQSLSFGLARRNFDTCVVIPVSEAAVLEELEAIGPDIVLLDLHLGEIGSALPIIEPVQARGARVIVMTGETSRARWGECLEAGASAVVPKTAPFEELLDRIDRLVAHEEAVDDRERHELLDALRASRRDERVRLEPFLRLSVRESEVLTDLTLGLTADAIAAKNYVSVATVRSHIRSVLRKLDVTCQLAAVAMAARAGWTSPHGTSTR